MEKEEKNNINIDETLKETEKEDDEEQGEGSKNLLPEEFPNEFQCCVCLELLYKPVVLACGHMSCFWCVFDAMNPVHESNCPICRCPYNHFPSVCQLLHFLLMKLYPIAYKRRERQVREEENRADRFSLQFDQNLVEPKLCENSDILGNKHTVAHFQTDLSSESCSKDWESSSFSDSPKTIMQDENDVSIKPMTSSNNPEVATNASNQGKSWLRNEFEHKDQKVVSIADVLCAACKRLLFQPVVLNCGHVYCESCFVIPKDEILRCKVCKSLQPNGYPSVCLILDHFLVEQFPEKYSERQEALLKEQNCSMQAQRHANRATSISTDAYSSWLLGNGPKVHAGVGCDFCGMSPIIGERYNCKDCVEKIGFDLCESCYNAPAKIPGRFNQQHKPEHEFEVIQPLRSSGLVFWPYSVRFGPVFWPSSVRFGPEHTDDASHTPTFSASFQPDQGDGSEDPEDISSSLILSVGVSLDQEDESDDPSDNISSDLT